ncbi:MAG: hypothetical protein ACK4M3_05360 [Pyrobaculum sp.]
MWQFLTSRRLAYNYTIQWDSCKAYVYMGDPTGGFLGYIAAGIDIPTDRGRKDKLPPMPLTDWYLSIREKIYGKKPEGDIRKNGGSLYDRIVEKRLGNKYSHISILVKRHDGELLDRHYSSWRG